MAQVLPAKRPRGLTDHHRASMNGIAGPSRHKRPRNSIEPSERSYSEDVQSRPDEDEEPTSIATDNADIDDETYLKQTQHLEKAFKESENKENVAAEAGIIEEIRCTNFMCHDQLTVPLGPLINFIIGHNGSGKSAVLTALTICLGGKASATNRGMNLKSFIKSDRTHASLAVKIKNRGDLAFKPEQYGHSIIIERNFSQAGSSGFKVKDQNGRIMSQKKVDVEDVIDAFNLQIDNPMNVLTQDMARQFLNASTPKEKYRFFLKGTQLEALDNDYKHIAFELEEQEARAQTLEGDLKVLEKTYREAVAKARRAEKLELVRKEEQELAYQAAWAQIESEERQLAQYEAGIDESASKIEMRTAKAEVESANYTQLDHSLGRAKEEVRECETELQPTQDNLKEHKDAFADVRRRIAQLKADERTLVGAVQADEKKVRETQISMQDTRDKQAEADNGLHARKVQEFEEARRNYEKSKSAWEAHNLSLPGLQSQMSDAKKAKQLADGKIQQKRTEENASKTKIRNLEQDTRRWIDSYRNAPGLERVLKAIQNESRFRERPVGPMGRHVELLKPEWGPILEKSFGQTLEGFVVSSKADQVLLSGILDRLNHRAPIYIGTKNHIDTSNHEPDRQLLTWMRAIKVNNDLVRNTLIINQSIEQVVLIQKRTEAWDFMIRPQAERRNAKMCICMSDGSRRRGHSIFPGASNFAPIEEFQGSFRMQADKGPQIQDEKDNLAAIQRDIGHLENDARAAQGHLNACQAKVQDHAGQKRALQVEMHDAQDYMASCEDAVSASIPDLAMMEVLEKALTEAQSHLERNEEQFSDLTKEMDKANAENRAHKDQIDSLSAIVKASEHRMDKLNAKVVTLTHRRETALRAKNKAIEEVEAAEHNKGEWEQKREEQLAALDAQTRDAELISPRVPVPEGGTFESLMAKRAKVETQREQMEKELGGSQQDLLRIANEARLVHDEAKKEIQGTASVRRALKLALKNRQQRWLEFRQAISLRARVVFSKLLSERRFRGNLQIDHKNQRLDIHVQPDITVQEGEGRQTKTLSGGEKSFSTICLLLALWDAMGSPIRCLDEFDVFMDSVNRDISVTMIVNAARRATGRQYILITPQSMSNQKVHSMSDVKIIRMGDPERGQTALNFQG